MNAAILVAAGKGARMGADVDKLFLPVAGRPVVAHTWQRFNDVKGIGEIILVVRPGMQKAFSQLAAKHIHQARIHHFPTGAVECHHRRPGCSPLRLQPESRPSAGST